MNQRIIGLGLVVWLSVLVLPGWSAENSLAVIDMGRVIKAHPKHESNTQILEKQLGEYRAEEEEMVAQLNRMKEDFEKARGDARNLALSEKAKQANLELAEKKLAELRDYEMKCRETSMERQKDLADQRVRMRRSMVAEIQKIVREYSEKNKISIVLDSAGVGVGGAEMVIYSHEKTDITEDVISAMKKMKN